MCLYTKVKFNFDEARLEYVIDNEDLDRINSLREMTRNLLLNMDNGDGFKDAFLEILNKPRVKIDSKFKYILTLLNYTAASDRDVWWLTQHKDIDSIRHSDDFKAFLQDAQAQTKEYNNFS